MGAYKHDFAAFGELVLRAPFMEAEMVRRMEAAKAEAEIIAPFDPNSTDGTHYKDSFHVESTTHGGAHKDRAEASLVNDDNAAVFIESGVRGRPGQHVLLRSLDAAGD